MGILELEQRASDCLSPYLSFRPWSRYTQPQPGLYCLVSRVCPAPSVCNSTAPALHRIYTLCARRMYHYPPTSQFSQAQLPTTLPRDSSARLVNMPKLRSRSVALQPTHLSTTSTSTLRLPPFVASYLVMRIFFPHSGLLFEFVLVEAASKTRCETAHIASVEVFW